MVVKGPWNIVLKGLCSKERLHEESPELLFKLQVCAKYELGLVWRLT